MNQSVVLPEIVFSEDELAKVTGLSTHELRLHQPDGFGVPGHWRPDGQRRHMVYTEKGVETLGAALKEVGYEAAAVCLRVTLQQQRETPSRALVSGVAKNDLKPWFRAGDMA